MCSINSSFQKISVVFFLVLLRRELIIFSAGNGVIFSAQHQGKYLIRLEFPAFSNMLTTKLISYRHRQCSFHIYRMRLAHVLEKLPLKGIQLLLMNSHYSALNNGHIEYVHYEAQNSNSHPQARSSFCTLI